MAITAKNMEELAQAILAWLEYQNIVGRKQLFSESYLSQPIGEFLLHHRTTNNSELKAEYNHPVLNLVPRVGRPSQIDFLMKSSKAITVAMEIKWLSSQSQNDVERIVHDLLRLEILHGFNNSQNDDIKAMVTNLKTKVLVCVSQKKLREQIKTEHPIGEFLLFDQSTDEKGVKTVDISTLSDFKAKTIVKNWLEKYTIKNQNGSTNDLKRFYKDNGKGEYELKISKQFETTLLCCLDSNNFCVDIWRIHQAKKGRKAKYTCSQL